MENHGKSWKMMEHVSFIGKWWNIRVSLSPKLPVSWCLMGQEQGDRRIMMFQTKGGNQWHIQSFRWCWFIRIHFWLEKGCSFLRIGDIWWSWENVIPVLTVVGQTEFPWEYCVWSKCSIYSIDCHPHKFWANHRLIPSSGWNIWLVIFWNHREHGIGIAIHSSLFVISLPFSLYVMCPSSTPIGYLRSHH